MSLFLHLYLNSTYIGRMRESEAHKLASLICTNVGDIATLRYDGDDSFYASLEEWDLTHTYYHNGSELLCFSHTSYFHSSIDSTEEIATARLRTSAYTSRLTGFKYDRSVMRGQTARSLKRDINRAARRVSRAYIDEQLS